MPPEGGAAAAGPGPVPFSPKGTVITVGTFDGVHRGHWAVLQEVCRYAVESGRRAVLVTFHPHPLRIVRPDAAPPLLTTPTEKKEILAESGLDYAVFVSFTPTLAAYPPERFVQEILMDRLHLAHLVIGFDHGFGRGRSGDPATLREIGARLGFEVDVVPASHVAGEPVSSSRIRAALAAGDVEAAAAGLGRPYSLLGSVIRGDGRGRQLGFPTANLRVADAEKLLPLAGVYAVTATVGPHRDDASELIARPGVLHLGPRPMFPGSPPSIELHLFDFHRDIYGEPVRVDFCARLRDIHNFATIPELVRAIEADCTAARALFLRGGGACREAGFPLA